MEYVLDQRTGDSRFLAALGMTTRKAKAKAKKKQQIPKGNDRKKGKSRRML
jgi:hypothetical protein